jgi:hypothetical protein
MCLTPWFPLSDVWLPLAQEQPPIERLDARQRAMVLMALLVILFLALMLLLLIWVGGRWVRRLARRRYEPPRPSLIGKSDWEPQPYVPPAEPHSPGDDEDYGI